MARPLDGVRILDFTWALAGPYGSMILCDLGAEVFKIEPVGTEARTRGPGPYLNGVDLYYFSINRGKKSLSIDLKSEPGRELVYRLVKQVDVVLENFTPGTMERLGFGYHKLAEINPSIIYGSTSGFGQTGPYSRRGAVDVIVQGMSGVMSITGHKDQPPARPGYSIGDMAGGMFTAIGILGAALERERSGRGQWVDVSMLDSQIALLENAVVRHLATGELPQRNGTRHPLVSPFQAFPTKDGFFVLAGTKNWELFCARINQDDLIFDERFKTGELRVKHQEELEELLNETFRQRTTSEWLDELEEVCLVAPLNTIADVVQDPQVQAREMIVPLPHPRGGEISVSNSPIKYSRTPLRVDRRAPEPSEHTAEILQAVLGLSNEEIDGFAAEGVIAVASPEER